MRYFFVHFFCYFHVNRPYVDTVGKNAKKITEYIQNQLSEDQISDKIVLKE